MAWELTAGDLPDLARGAAILGTGGGGDPYLGKSMVAAAMADRDAPLTILDPDDLDADSLVIPTGGMGAPTVLIEKLPKGTEAADALHALERHLGQAADATMAVECGGFNSMVPLLVAAQRGLPVVDADGMGRAFPETQMETFSVYGVRGSPMAVVDEHGSTAVVDTGADDRRLEWLTRALTIRMGGTAYLAQYAMSGADVRRTAVPRTTTLALRIGRAVREARERGGDPFAALAETIAGTSYRHGRVIFGGKVVDVERRTTEGFTRGRVRIAAFTGDAECEIVFQNEHLVARVDGRLRTIVPDLIAVLQADTAEPVTTEGLRYGQRVRVFAIGTPPIMRTPAALATFGPRAFGFDQDFVPIESLDESADAAPGVEPGRPARPGESTTPPDRPGGRSA